MTLPTSRLLWAALACVAAFAVTNPSQAGTVNLKADLKASSEVPPNDSKGNGTLTATYDDVTKTLTWKGSVSGLTGPATAAHFHAGDPGKNGGVVIPIAGAEKGQFEGKATLTEAQANEMLGGRWYVNVHTAANKAGELRGQLTK
jgi:hypothetical protein